MKTGSEQDPRLRRALTAGLPREAPPHLLEAVAQRTAGVSQRPAMPMAWLLRPRSAQLALAGAVFAVAAGFVVLRLLPVQTGSPVASAPLMTAPSRPSIPADGGCDEQAGCLGLLPAGSGSSQIFQPPVTFTVPAGWMNRDDRGGIFELRPSNAPGDMIGIYRDPLPVEAGRIVPGVPETAQALADFLRQDGDLVVAPVQRATVGGLNGWATDVTTDPSATRSSVNCPGIRCVTVFTGKDPAPRPVWLFNLTVPEGSRVRIYLLDAPGGVVTMSVLAWDGATFGDVVASASTIIDSLRFGPP